MTPKEKAFQIYIRYKIIKHSSSVRLQKIRSKTCAKIAVDEIINAIDWHEFETPNKEFEFWDEVKKEIEKI